MNTVYTGNKVSGPSFLPPWEALTIDANALLAAVGGGCRDSFKDFYKLTSCRVYASLCRLLRNVSDAEESLQDTYVKVWRSAACFDQERGNAVVWLLAIARNCAMDMMRRAGARPPLTGALSLDNTDPYEGVGSDEEHVSTTIARKRAIRQVHVALRQLESKQRQCVSLALFEGLSHTEISAHMQYPLGTVKSYIRRAIERIQPLISEY